MSAQAFSFSQQSSTNQLTVSFQFLLSLYYSIPVCLVLLRLDKLVFNYALRDFLPSSPSHFLLFQIFFGTPHIIASNLLLATHPDYLQTYKKKIMIMTLFIVVFFGVGSLFIPYRVLYVISACWTVYHVLKQQLGVAKAVCRLPGWAFFLQLFLCVASGIFIYLGVFMKNSLSAEQADLVLKIAGLLTLTLLLTTAICQKQVSTSLGRQFLWANTLLVASSFYVYSEQYYFLAILMPRLIHDITAYSFYITHDVNRHGRQPDNTFYRLNHALHIPPAFVLPIFSLVLTYLLQAYGDDWVNWLMKTVLSTQIYKAVTLGLIGYLALMHYYTESFVWAAGSPLRRYIRFSGISATSARGNPLLKD